MKKIYCKPTLSIVFIDNQDIIATSTNMYIMMGTGDYADYSEENL